MHRIALGLVALSAFHLAPEPVRYRFETRTHQSIDMSAAGMGQVDADVTVTSWVTITTRDTTGGQVIRITVDTSALVTNMGELATMMSPPKKGASIEMLVEKGKI